MTVWTRRNVNYILASLAVSMATILIANVYVHIRTPFLIALIALNAALLAGGITWHVRNPATGNA